MRLFDRIKFALRYDFDHAFRAYDYEGRMPYTFVNYEDAVAFQKSQPMYNTPILVIVRKK